MPVAITPLGPVYVEGDYSSASIGGTVNIGSGPGEVFACISCWVPGGAFTGGAIDGAAWSIVGQSYAAGGEVPVAILRASPSGTGSVSFNFTGNSSMGGLVAFFFRVADAAPGTVSSGGKAVSPAATESLSIATVAGGFTLGVAGFYEETPAVPSFTGFTNATDGGAVISWAQNLTGYRADAATGPGTVQITGGQDTRHMFVASFGPADEPEPVYLDAPPARYVIGFPLPSLVRGYVRTASAARYSLRLPLPGLTIHRQIDAPAARIGLRFPLPSLSFARVLVAPAARLRLRFPLPSRTMTVRLEAPVGRYGLRFPLPSLASGQTLVAPTARYGLRLPLPGLETHRNLDAPAARYRLSLPLPALVTGATLDAPAARLHLRLPLPFLQFHRQIVAPAARLALRFPLPSLASGGVLDAPTARYVVRLPLPELVSRAVLVAPAARYVLRLPMPGLRFAAILDAPAAHYALRFPVPILVTPDSSRRRAAFVIDSANGGIFTSRAPGRLVSDGITGGTIIRE